jgi:hypothetical protein
LDDDLFCLLPKEQRIVLVDWYDVAPHERCVSIDARNTEPQHIVVGAQASRLPL